MSTKKLNKLGDNKIFNFKKWNRNQKGKVCKPVRDQKAWKQIKDGAQGLL